MRVPCPTCGQSAEFNLSNPHRPFCSERCRWVDLGAWLDERYAVPGETAHDEASSTPDPRPTGPAAEES